MKINKQEHIDCLRNTIMSNADIAYATIQKIISSMSPVQFFATVKFEKVGRDPIEGYAQNMIEQINQMYSDLVVLAAAEDLLKQFPGITLELHLGAASGYDIESDDGSVVAECFSVTSVTSNRKLHKDCQKLQKAVAPIKCIYFYSHNDSEANLLSQFPKYPDIRFHRVSLDALHASTLS